MAEIKADVAYAGVELSGDNAAAVTDFAVRLFQHSAEDGRTPDFSSFCPHGSFHDCKRRKGNTLAQMEDVFGIQVAELNPICMPISKHSCR